MRTPSLALALVLALAPGAARAATYHVDPAGDDGGPGSQAQPWRTLQKAADTVAAGDTVLVRAGSYTGFFIDTPGTAQAPIVFRADPGVLVVADNPVTPDGINIEGADWVTVEGFTVNGRTRTGIRAALASNVTIRDNRMDLNGRWGILTGFCDDLLIEGNECTRSVAEHGIYVSNSGDRPTIRRNVCSGNFANGIHMNGDVSLGGDGVISGALVEQNVIFDNGVGGGSGINCDGVQGSTFRNNLIYDTHASGISLYRIDGGAPSTNNLVVCNTVVVASDGRWCLNVQDGSTGNTAFSNIFLNRHSFRGSISISADSLPGFTSDFNVVMDRFTTDGGNTRLTLAQWRQQTGRDGSSLVAAAADVFVDDAADDYRLEAGSPAVDAGTVLSAPPTDLAGLGRPLGADVDAGAYEQCPSGQTCTPSGPGAPAPSPAPPPPPAGSAPPSGGGGGGGGGCALGGHGHPATLMPFLVLLAALAFRRILLRK